MAVDLLTPDPRNTRAHPPGQVARGFLRALALGTLILVGANSSPAKAVPIFDFFTGNYRIFTGVVDLTPQTDFVASQITLGLDSGFIDFETLPDGSPTQGNTVGGRFPADHRSTCGAQSIEHDSSGGGFGAAE